LKKKNPISSHTPKKFSLRLQHPQLINKKNSQYHLDLYVHTEHKYEPMRERERDGDFTDNFNVLKQRQKKERVYFPRQAGRQAGRQ